MSLQDEVDIDCPFCGESITVLVDTSPGNQQYVEDCQVCCSPILLNVEIDDMQNVQVFAQQENA